jgi:phenylpropionate dioxygenase-like ring-hydroxylating dioxygenase large terminal subunit
MLTKEENERLTHVGPGTPMGETLRHYWLPALLADELPEPDCPPVRVRMLGEDLVAFRDTDGRVGLLATHCAHRGASLFFGRNEECGLRCVYHGWKFDVDGRCLDMPNEPPESTFKDRVRQPAYPCVEAGEMIWTYLGPPAQQPPVVDLEWMRAPRGHLNVSKTYEQCNYLQALEGGVDTAHSAFLHRFYGGARANRATERFRVRAAAPRLEAHPTDYGFSYAGLRTLPDDGSQYVRVYQFIMPAHQMRAYEGYCDRPLIQGHVWVPIDDEQTWVYNWAYVADGSALLPAEIEAEMTETGRAASDMLDGRFYPIRNRANDYQLDRQAQRTVNFTGIQGVNTQDMAIQESMGPIFDRTREHLGTSDVAVITMRRLLLEATHAVEVGRDPLGVHGSADLVRPAETVLPAGASWPEAMQEALLARW